MYVMTPLFLCLVALVQHERKRGSHLRTYSPLLTPYPTPPRRFSLTSHACSAAAAALAPVSSRPVPAPLAHVSSRFVSPRFGSNRFGSSRFGSPRLVSFRAVTRRDHRCDNVGATGLPGAAGGPRDPGGDPRRGVGRGAGLEQDGGPVPQPPHQEVRSYSIREAQLLLGLNFVVFESMRELGRPFFLGGGGGILSFVPSWPATRDSYDRRRWYERFSATST